MTEVGRSSSDDSPATTGRAGRDWVLGPDWLPGPDGMRFRRGARVILVDPADRVLLLRGHDVEQPERSWWFTVGGGIDAGEDDRAAAVREVREEVGVELDPAELAGPVFTRSAVFDFYAQRCRQDEVIFLARVDPIDTATIDRSAWTVIEQESVDEVRWWTLDELAVVDIEVFPEGLPELVRPLLGGWDGVTRHLGLGVG